MSRKKGILCGLGWTVVGIAILLFIVLLSLSFSDLNNDEYGLLYHPYTCQLETELRSEGKYYSSDPAAYFFIFNSKSISLDFGDNATIGTLTSGGDGNSVTSDTDTGGAISCNSKDGLEIVLQLKVFYNLDGVANDLYKFFLTFSIDYEFILVAMIRSAVMNACQVHTGQEFYYKRTSTELTMKNSVELAVESIGLTFETLQLANIDLPDDFSNAIAAKEVARTAIDAAVNARAQAETQAATAVSQAALDADLAKSVANRDAEAIRSAANATAQSLRLSIDASREALTQIQVALSLTPTELLNYVAIDQLSSSTDVRVAVESPANFGA